MARRVNNLEFAIREDNRRSEVQEFLGWRWLQDGTREIQVVFGNRSYTEGQWESVQELHNWPIVAERHYRRVSWSYDRIRTIEYRVEIAWAPMWIHEEWFGERRQGLDEFLHEHPEPIGQAVQVQANVVDQPADEQMQIEMAPDAEPNMAPLAEMEIAQEDGEPYGGAMPPVPEPVPADVDMIEDAIAHLAFAGQFAR